ncbi:hypothetical protein MMC26_001531 [Xylographa opegraphella]|nr:hypothetical protein [Xylographa opegraphella]
MKPTVAFFGATGGCANAALALALKNGYHCSAFVRTPANLTTMLLAKGVSQELIDSHLQIVKGDIRDMPTIKPALVLNSRIVDIIVSGLGSTPSLKAKVDWTICRDGVPNILEAVASLQSPTPPFLAVISTTGISHGRRDVPLAFVPIYRVALASPHEDKRLMEDAVRKAASGTRDGRALISGYTIVRPSLLVDWKEGAKLRVGTEEEPTLGYTVSRQNVGRWIYEDVIAEGGGKWSGKAVTLTY